jgi:hypothetical protein
VRVNEVLPRSSPMLLGPSHAPCGWAFLPSLSADEAVTSHRTSTDIKMTSDYSSTHSFHDHPPDPGIH